MSIARQPTDYARTRPSNSTRAAAWLELGEGESVGRYLVVSKLGEGGMGVVYAARDPDLGRMVAIKLLRTAGSADDEDQRRLLREAQALARIPHRNLVAVYDVGTHRGGVFVAMEYLEGETLDVWLEQRPRRWREIVAVFVQAGRGLAAAHAAEVVHRDFKPGNVIVQKDGAVQVLDFGLARRADAIETEVESTGVVPLDDALAANLTRAGGIVGTPAYMAPEQHLGVSTDPRTDQFSFCVALYEAIYGQRPFAGKDLVSLMDATLRGLSRDPPAIDDLPLEIRAALRKGLSPDRAERFRCMDDLLGVLDGPVSGSRHRRRFAWRLVGTTILMAATATITWQLAVREVGIAPVPPPVNVAEPAAVPMAPFVVAPAESVVSAEAPAASESADGDAFPPAPLESEPEPEPEPTNKPELFAPAWEVAPAGSSKPTGRKSPSVLPSVDELPAADPPDPVTSQAWGEVTGERPPDLEEPLESIMGTSADTPEDEGTGDRGSLDPPGGDQTD